ncbi:cytochrome c oxidase accessory protein CcoG [Candidatus Uabimicrobium sp. HlEnr_7]|uniref:cytochrome c oxidase accessory protein CcoG n=1 Tax=Candidatus Uabimicrobium helgolandensis TaxID=3095367 RepID=UPI0035578DC4
MNAADNFKDRIATVNQDGERIWIYPKRVNGPYYKWRKIISYIQLIVLIGLPFVKYNGRPVVMLNIIERKFIFFGNVFWSEDLYLFGLLFITTVIFITWFTATFGRIFCGWLCPQTVFLEMVFRRIERFLEGDASKQKKFNKQKASMQKTLRKIFKHILFYAISFFIANIFLSYIIGIDELWKIITAPPSEHLVGFFTICAFSFIFYGVFSWFREQACIMVCPYGRLQSVMQDANTVTISYDFKRGEPRGHKLKKNISNQGDCIDCKKCVAVCPTGIDIRNGLQMECVNCTFCIDACDDVMEKINKPKGLIRYASHNMIEKQHPFKISMRTIFYGFIFLALFSVDAFLIYNRPQVNAIINRMPGSLCTKIGENSYMNVYRSTLFNKTLDPHTYNFKLLDIKGEVRLGDENINVVGESLEKFTMIIVLPKESIDSEQTYFDIGIFEKDKLIQKIEIGFKGP